MNQNPIRTFVVGFDNISNVIRTLAASNIINPVIWLEHEKKHGTHCTQEIMARKDSVASATPTIPLEILQRLFDKYFALFSSNLARHDSYSGGNTNYASARYVFSNLASYLYSLMASNGIELYLHCTYPHEIVDTMAYLLAQELKIECMLLPPLFYSKPDRFYILSDFDEYGLWKGREIVDQDVAFNIEDYGMTAKVLTTHSHAGYSARNAGIMRARFPCNINNRLLREEYEYNLARYTVSDADLQGDFVYFPLHYQPEASICAQSDILWDDQTILAERISRMLPQGCLLYLKENPMQTFYYRDPAFFENMARLGNVRFVSTKISSRRLVEKCRFVVTVTGTAGWEALALGKPVVYTGFPLYREVPGAIQYSDELNFEQILSKKPSFDDVLEAGRQVLMRSYKGIPNPLGGQSSPENERLVTAALKNHISRLNLQLVDTPKYSDLKSVATTENKVTHVQTTGNIRPRLRLRQLLMLALLSSLRRLITAYTKP